MKADSRKDVMEIAGHFGAAASIQVEGLGSGNINDTYLVVSGKGQFILQRINGQVFPDPENVARNTACVSNFLHSQLAEDEEWCFPEVLPADEGRQWYEDHEGNIWRAQSYIGGTRVFDIVEDSNTARQAGRCLGKFHQVMKGFKPQLLLPVLPGFHDTLAYLKSYDVAVSTHSQGAHEDARSCVESIERLRGRSGFFDEAVQAGAISPKIVHGDPKINNFLFRERTATAVALIDLDTVGPGLILQDIGDAIRSCCCPLAEGDETGSFHCDTNLLQTFLQGYLYSSELSQFELRHIFDAVLVITFELGLRFFTDYLQGNVYFKVADDRENLRRAMQQFCLAENILSRESIIRESIEKAL